MDIIDRCRHCGACRVVRPTPAWQYACKCDDPEQRPKVVITRLQAENKELKENLIEYGRHSAGCSQEYAAKYRCRCGWDKVEQALKK